MRKYIFFIFLLLIVATSNDIYAQAKRRPLPDWIFEKPERSNRTFYYHVEKGFGETETEARNAAYTQAFMQVAMKLGIPINTSDISNAINSGTNVKMLSQQFTIPMNVVCFYSRHDDEIGGWNYWLLCQIPELGYADNARFDDFNDCFKHERFDQHMKEQAAAAAKQKEDSIRKVNGRNAMALLASTFIPGSGQMLKGHGGSGAAFLVGELAIFGGGTVCHFLGEEQLKIMKSTKDYAEFQNAQNMKNTMDIAKWTCFGVGAAVHIGNMIHAWFVSDKKAPTNFTFVPALIPTNEFATTEYAVGAGVQITF